MEKLNYLKQLAMDMKVHLEYDVQLIKGHLKNNDLETAQDVLDETSSHAFFFTKTCINHSGEQREEIQILIDEVNNMWVDIDDEWQAKIWELENKQKQGV